MVTMTNDHGLVDVSGSLLNRIVITFIQYFLIFIQAKQRTVQVHSYKENMFVDQPSTPLSYNDHFIRMSV